MVNLAFLKKELEKVSSTTSNQDVRWKPAAGKTVIRLLPYPPTPDFPFRILRFHYELTPSVFCLENEEEGTCPICKAATKLWQKGKDDVDSRNLAKKLFARDRYFAPVFVRSENGVDVNEMRIWGFGKRVYKQILDFYTEYELDFTDTKEAPDIIVKYVDPVDDQSFGETSILVDPKTLKTPRPLASTQKEIDAIVESIPVIDETYVHKTEKEAIEILEKYLNSTNKPSESSSNKTTVEKMKAEAIEETASSDEPDKSDSLSEELDDLFND
jgi:hypothetical protein